MEWKEPPLRTRKPSSVATNYAVLADTLRRKPGKWLLAKSYAAEAPNGSRASYLKLRLSALLGAEHVEVRSHHANGRGEVYARYCK